MRFSKKNVLIFEEECATIQRDVLVFRPFLKHEVVRYSKAEFDFAKFEHLQIDI